MHLGIELQGLGMDWNQSSFYDTKGQDIKKCLLRQENRSNLMRLVQSEFYDIILGENVYNFVHNTILLWNDKQSKLVLEISL